MFHICIETAVAVGHDDGCAVKRGIPFNIAAAQPDGVVITETVQKIDYGKLFVFRNNVVRENRIESHLFSQNT